MDVRGRRSTAPWLRGHADLETLLTLAPSLTLPEPSIARLSSDGESVFAVGATEVYRLRLNRSAGLLELDRSWRPSYGPSPGRSYGWDPVVTDEHLIWMDNGRKDTDRTMLGSGSSPDPLRLWWARLDDSSATCSTEISGLAFGTESNPPAWDPQGRIVIAYDAGNAVLRAWRMSGDELEPLWRKDGFAHAGHLIVHPDTRELITQDWSDLAVMRRPALRRPLKPALALLSGSALARRSSLRTGSDSIVVLDLDSGTEKARVKVPSPSQGFCSRHRGSAATSTTSR